MFHTRITVGIVITGLELKYFQLRVYFAHRKLQFDKSKFHKK